MWTVGWTTVWIILECLDDRRVVLFHRQIAYQKSAEHS